MTFLSAGGTHGFTFNTGTATLTINGSGITNNDTATQTFNVPVAVSSVQTWNAASGGLAFNNITLSNALTLSGAANISAAGTLTNSSGDRTITNNSTGAVTINNINLSEGNTARTLTVSGTGTTAASGVIANGGTSAGNLVKAGTGTLVLSGANTYTGTTTISAGVLSVQSAGALGTAANTSTTTVANGAVLQLANNITTTNAGTLVLNGTGTGSGALQSVGGNNTWNGIMALGSDATIFSATAGNTLFLNDNYVAAHTLTIGNHTLTVDGPGDTFANSNVGVIGDTGGLVKNGTGTLTLYGYNTYYTGATTVNAGSLELVVGPFSTGWYGINGSLTIGTGPSNPALAGTVKVDIWSNSYANQISPNSAVTINSDGILNVGASTGLGSLTLNGGQVSIASGQGITPSGSITSNANSAHLTSLISGGQVNLASPTNVIVARDATLASDLTISSVLAGTGGLTKAGSGILTLSGANTYTGVTTVSGGILNISADNNLGTVPGVATANELTLNGGTLQAAANMTLNSNRGITLGAGGGTLDVNPGTTLTYGGIIAGSGSLTKADSGSLLLSGANTYTGATTINAGTLQLGASNVLPGTAVTISSGATLNLNNFSNTVGSLAGAGNVTLGTGTLTTGADGTSTTFSGVISGTGNLTKAGTGTLTLAGVNTHSGATNINAGTLRLGANSVLSNSTAVTVAGGATLNLNNYSDTVGSLAGAGIITLGSGTLTVGANNASTTFSGSFTSGDTGTFAKTGTGTLTFGAGMNLSGGNLVLNGGTLKLGGFTSTFGSLSVTANSILDFGTSGSSVLNILSSLTVNSGVTLTIANWTDAVDYFYSLTNPGATNLGRIVFTGFTGPDTKWLPYDHQVTPVPEPSTYGALLMSSLLAFAAWRRLRTKRSPDQACSA